MKKYLVLLVTFYSCHSIYCQNIGIGTNNPQNKLHIAGGLRIDTLANNIDSGLVRHDKFGVAYSLKFTGNATDVLRGNGTFGASSSSSWSLTGNSGTNPAINFIGTTGAQPLKFKVNNVIAGFLDASSFNTSFGVLTLNSNVNGAANSAFGMQTLVSNTNGNFNSASGYYSLYSNQTGNDNTANGGFALNSNINGNRNTGIGYQSLYFNTSGNNNIASGSFALYFNSSGNNNTASGNSALYFNTNGFSNVAIGSSALYNNASGSNLVAIGDSSLFNNTGSGGGNTAVGSKALYANTNGFSNTAHGFKSQYANTTGNYNSSFGHESLLSNQNGYDNTATGTSVLYNNTSGYGNTALGSYSLYSNQTGNRNTAIGVGADVLVGNLSNATAIGANATVGSSNSLVLGGTGSNAVKVGIGVSSPIVTLHVKGSANIFSGADTHTGNFYSGTSNVDGIEMVSSGLLTYVGIQSSSGGLSVSRPSDGILQTFYVNGVFVGNINSSGGNTFYMSTSDMRLKENILPTHHGLKTLMQINVADYNYKSDDKKRLQTGFLAQELYKLYPQAVQVGGNDVKTNPWMIDYSKITPLLVKSIQEQQQQIESQRNDIEFLKLQVAELNIAIKKLTR